MSKEAGRKAGDGIVAEQDLGEPRHCPENALGQLADVVVVDVQVLNDKQFVAQPADPVGPAEVAVHNRCGSQNTKSEKLGPEAAREAVEGIVAQ